jgi:hypothetical protein
LAKFGLRKSKRWRLQPNIQLPMFAII